MFRPIPGLISCAGVTRRWRLLSHAQHVVRWLALSKRSGRSSYILHTACTLHLRPKPLLCIHVIKLNCWNTWSVGRPRRLRRPRSSLHCSPLHGALPYNIHLSWRDYTTVTVKWLPPQTYLLTLIRHQKASPVMNVLSENWMYSFQVTHVATACKVGNPLTTDNWVD